MLWERSRSLDSVPFGHCAQDDNIVSRLMGLVAAQGYHGVDFGGVAGWEPGC